MKRIELLAPAKNLEVAKAAIIAGADAVYIGGPSFGARANANNSMDDINSLCCFAHRFGVRVYLALNTLLFDDEIEKAQEIITEAKHAGVDAIIVQDPALFTLAQLQGVEVHASTQLNICTLEQVDHCHDLGIAQIVLPREFDLESIKYFCSSRPNMRFEVFVSGAMCVSVSGVCFISENMVAEDRSANRGACAQICRLPMDLYRDDKVIASGHLLSMKDNLRLDHLEELVLAGVSSFKIEGRLKDKDYVINQVAAFSNELDKIIKLYPDQFMRSSMGTLERNFTPDVNKTFNRGFSANLLMGSNDNIVDISTPKSKGEYIGKVVSCYYQKGKSKDYTIELKLEKECTLNNGDSFTFFNQHNELCGFRVNRVEKSPKKSHVLLFLNTQVEGLNINTALNRNVDTFFIKSITMPKAMSRKVELSAHLKLEQNQLELSFIDNYSRTVSSSIELNTDDNAQALPVKVLKEKLIKLGDNYLSLKEENISFSGDASKIKLAISSFNNFRRQVLEQYIALVEMNYLNCKKQGKFYLDEAINMDYRRNFKPKAIEDLPLFVHAVDERLITNRISRAYYEHINQGEIKKTNPLISKAVMTCRNCLINNHALCKNKGGKTQGFYLMIGKHRFDIVTNCRDCLMYLIPPKQA